MSPTDLFNLIFFTRIFGADHVTPIIAVLITSLWAAYHKRSAVWFIKMVVGMWVIHEAAWDAFSLLIHTNLYFQYQSFWVIAQGLVVMVIFGHVAKRYYHATWCQAFMWTVPTIMFHLLWASAGFPITRLPISTIVHVAIDNGIIPNIWEVTSWLTTCITCAYALARGKPK